MKRIITSPRLLVVLLLISITASLSFAAGRTKRSSRVPQRSAVTKSRATAAARKAKPTTKPAKTITRKTRKRGGRVVSTRLRGAKLRRVSTRGAGNFVAGGPWLEPTFADSTLGDNIDGEDLAVRRAAVDALGAFNGSVVVVDPSNGRILTIVNQKVAFSNGFQPCSTIKVYAALAGLSEGVIGNGDTRQRLYGRVSMDLTDALAKSNNPYFANIGVKLGYDRMAHYARMFGLGEKAGLDIPEEQPGVFSDAPPKFGGMGMMTSFGEGVKLTPLQLASLMASLANGGTMYYLQYPRSQAEAEVMEPRVKRRLPIEQLIPEVTPGMLGATEYGTARRAGYAADEPILGKTGTCTDRATPTHLGWFGSFNEVNGRKLAVVVLLTGGRHVNGPAASGVAGRIYQTLSQLRLSALSNASLTTEEPSVDESDGSL
ncbi:MAG: penicillin-binding protein [Bryobacteraceae bacterium]|nr:penicillin-binding protein [Bryobacteraceae bacterium]